MARYLCKIANVTDGVYYPVGQIVDALVNPNELFFVLYADQTPPPPPGAVDAEMVYDLINGKWVRQDSINDQCLQEDIDQDVDPHFVQMAKTSQSLFATTYSGGATNTYTALNVPDEFDPAITPCVLIDFATFNYNDGAKLVFKGVEYTMYFMGSPIPARTISTREICGVYLSGGIAHVHGVDIERATNQDVLDGISPTKYITPAGLKNAFDTSPVVARTPDVLTAISQIYNQAVAYTDSVVKEYETISLYLQPGNVMSTAKPVGTGTIINTALNTTEKLIYQASYIIPNSGVVLKDNMYLLDLFFSSVIPELLTYVRAEYTVGTATVFNVTSVLNAARPEYEFSRQIVNQLSEDTPFAANTVATLKLYGRLDKDTDTLSLTIGSATKPSGLYRNAPISTLGAGKITTAARGTAESQEAFNTAEWTAIQALQGN